MFSFERRITFRAPRPGVRPATLWVGRRSWRVQIVDESSGGIGIVAETGTPPAVGIKAELETDDGECLAVCVARCEQGDGWLRIGLKRELFQPPVACHSRQTLSPLIMLVGITLGLYAGFVASSESLRTRLAHLPTVSWILYR